MKKPTVLLIALLLLLTACRPASSEPPQNTAEAVSVDMVSPAASPVQTTEPPVPTEPTEAPATPAQSTEPPADTPKAPAVQIPQTGWTEAVPSSYRAASSHPGTVVSLIYDTADYPRGDAPIQKTAFVYLPYGYDENDAETRYDILYLMHGWGGHAGEHFELSYIKNMFDRLIENGDIVPMIIVSPSFYNENSERDFDGSIDELRAFHSEFRNDLMPAVEGVFHTYAASVSDADLLASRDHRAFGGFSFGGVTTWLELCYDFDYIRWFLPMSGGCWYYGTYEDYRFADNVDFIGQLVRDNRLDERGYFIYHAVGTDDWYKTMSVGMAEEMLSRGTFSADHYVFYQKRDGVHNYQAVQEYLYNALPLFFRGVE